MGSGDEGVRIPHFPLLRYGCHLGLELECAIEGGVDRSARGLDRMMKIVVMVVDHGCDRDRGRIHATC